MTDKNRKDELIYKRWLQTSFLDDIVDDYDKCLEVAKRLQAVIDGLDKKSSRQERDNALLEEIEKLKEEKILIKED
jgi:hypothetical protein